MFRNNDISDGGRVIVIKPADADDILSLADCKKALGVASSSQDDVIQAALWAAIDHLDGPAGILGRAVGPQTLELQLQSFNDRRASVAPHYNPLAIPLACPPLLSIVSVKYLDQSGADQTLAAGSGYRVLGLGQPARQAIAPPYNGAWPSARVDDASVRVRYTCGYDDSQNAMPRQIRAALCLMVRELLPLVSRDQTVMEDRVEGVGSKRYQNNPEFAQVVRRAADSLLFNLVVS